jgi:hypothetical protein
VRISGISDLSTDSNRRKAFFYYKATEQKHGQTRTTTLEMFTNLCYNFGKYNKRGDIP